MLKVVNKLLEEQRGSSELQIYEDFAKEQVERINAQNVQWLSKQSFYETAPEIQFTEMKIEGEAHE